MSPFAQNETIGIIGSPSTTSEITLDLVGEAAQRAVVGALLVFEQSTGDRMECAIGTVTEVETVNQWHENTAMRGVIAKHGSLPNLSGRADVKGVTVKVQAAYWRNHDEPDTYHQLGASLSTSPTTGERAFRVSNETIRLLTNTEHDSIYTIGDIYKSNGVRLPLNLPDFNRPEGAYHMATFGKTGSGKTACVEFELAARLGRCPDLGALIVDPQSQWTNQSGFVFDLHKWVKALGRPLTIRRISTDMRLPKDAGLLVDMVKAGSFMQRIRIPKGDKVNQAADEFREILRGYNTRHGSGWEEDDPGVVLRRLLEDFVGDGNHKGTNRLKYVYASKDAFERVRDQVQAYLDDANEFAYNLLPVFAPFHNLFAAENTTGNPRHSVRGDLSALFDGTPGQPRGILILDMGADGADHDVFDDENIKARILKRVCDTIEQASKKKYDQGKMLNTLVLFDEAHRYAPPPSGTDSDQIKELSDNLVRRVRETRKYGLGWSFITQTPNSLNPAIWAQLAVRVFGYGLTGSDLRKLEEEVDDRNALSLYKSFADPSSTRPRIYPYMLSGPVSPLSFTKTPVFLQTFTSVEEFIAANNWLPAGFPDAAHFTLCPSSHTPSAPGTEDEPGYDPEDVFDW